jgi:putative transposase
MTSLPNTIRTGVGRTPVGAASRGDNRMPASRRLRVGRWGVADVLAMVTKRRHKACHIDLTDPAVAQPIAESLLEARRRGRCYLLAWCLMPEHIHVLLVPRPLAGKSKGSSEDPRVLQSFIGAWVGTAAHLVNRVAHRNGPVWQEGFHDHRIRRTERVQAVVKYVHENPVRRGLAATPEEWQWSSAHDGFAEATDWDWAYGYRREDAAPTVVRAES